MNLLEMQKVFITPEFDYVKLVGFLSMYKNPRDQITKLISSGSIVRVKKGIYVLGPEFDKPFSHEILANIIFGPSYVSGISALAYYQMIPERTHGVTSRAAYRDRMFDTPLGRFSYKRLAIEKFVPSVSRVEVDRWRSFLIATPEKAIVELISEIKEIETLADIQDWFKSMRIDEESIVRLRTTYIHELESIFDKKIVVLLAKYLVEVKRA